jgi:Ribbon-helix-helix protein, copG family.
MAGKKITMSLSEKTAEILERLANEKGMKKSAIVALALAEYAEKQKGVVHEGK